MLLFCLLINENVVNMSEKFNAGNENPSADYERRQMDARLIVMHLSCCLIFNAFFKHRFAKRRAVEFG